MFDWVGIATLAMVAAGALFLRQLLASRASKELRREALRVAIPIAGWLLALIAGGVAGQAFGLAASGEGAQWLALGIVAALGAYALGWALVRARSAANF
ncbi:MAG: hypothetical protein LC790_01075 [Actinobacteria bacterium]|nr:hypothetical protein [Actinomycetota bacterium]